MIVQVFLLRGSVIATHEGRVIIARDLMELREVPSSWNAVSLALPAGDPPAWCVSVSEWMRLDPIQAESRVFG